MKWKDYNAFKPEKRHIKNGTQFLVKGFFQINDSIGETHYLTARLCNYFDDDTIMFETPYNFNILEWCYIDK